MLTRKQRANLISALVQVCCCCCVTIRDIDGLTPSVDVTAAALSEAVAQGLAALRPDQRVARIPVGLNTVHVSVATVRVDHEVKMPDCERCLEKPGKSPGEVVERERIRKILSDEGYRVERI